MSRSPHRRLGAAYAHEIRPEHVGRRVTIRHLVEHDGAERPTDVVGHLEGWDRDGQLAVRRRDGELVHVPADRVIASRLLPDAPPRRRG